MNLQFIRFEKGLKDITFIYYHYSWMPCGKRGETENVEVHGNIFSIKFNKFCSVCSSGRRKNCSNPFLYEDFRNCSIEHKSLSAEKRRKSSASSDAFAAYMSTAGKRFQIYVHRNFLRRARRAIWSIELKKLSKVNRIYIRRDDEIKCCNQFESSWIKNFHLNIKFSVLTLCVVNS